MQTVLIDDDFISVFLTKKLLQREGFGETVQSFQSPQQAVRYLQHTLPAQMPEVIFLDLNMPLLSGWDVLEALQPYAAQLRERCLIYLLTSSLALTDQARAQDCALVTALLHKPLDEVQLRAIHAAVVERRGPH